MIVSDASPLIAFARIGKISILKKVLGDLIIPLSVFSECCGYIDKPGAKEIEKLVKNGEILVKTHACSEKVKPFQDILDIGELQAISLALELQSGLLIDEKLGRAVAKDFNIKIIGTAGVLLLAYQKNIISSIPDTVSELQRAGYYLSKKLINTLLA